MPSLRRSGELDRIRATKHWQGFLQGFGISHACRLQCRRLRLQPGEFVVHKLDAGQLGFGLAGEAVEGVFFVVDGDFHLKVQL